MQRLFADSRSIVRIAGTQAGEGLIEIALRLLLGSDLGILFEYESESSTQQTLNIQLLTPALSGAYCGTRQNLLIFGDESL